MIRKIAGEGCVIHCRVSSSKQSQEGESLDVQAAICQKMAEKNGWRLAHEPWLESFSGRKEERPVFEEILDFLDKNPGLVRYYVFRSIDRFTRGGAAIYEKMKRELFIRGVEAVDVAGVIQPKRNTLEDLGISYPWSLSSPSERTETMEAADAASELKKILTRTIGQSIRNTQEGYRSRRPADGYANERVFIEGKKKTIQIPHPERARFYIAMFELRAQGLLDSEIVARINAMGYRSEIQNRYNKEHTKIVGQRGGNPLTVKQLQRNIRNTIYAGVLCEKWTNYQPVKAQYPGLVSVELFNRANKGELALITNTDGAIELVRGKARSERRSRNNPLFPFKFILCPVCRKPFLGSESRGKSGKKIPAYHCARNHTRVGVNKKVFEESISKYIGSLRFQPDLLNGLEVSFLHKYRQREQEIVQASGEIHTHIGELEAEQASKLKAFEATKSSVVREKLEQEIEALEVRIKSTGAERKKIQITRDDIKTFMAEARKIMEHPAEMLLNPKDIRVQCDLFSLVFEKTPTYAEIVNGTPKLSYAFELSSTFVPDENQWGCPQGIEP